MIGTDHTCSPPHTNHRSAEWEPSAKDLKTYRHFDAPINIAAVKNLVRNPENIVEHGFLPLLHFEQKWRRPPKDGKSRKPKIRPIRYASRKDAYIYKHYRELLIGPYEDILRNNKLENVVLAYRRVPISEGSTTHKTNVEFARDAFKAIKSLGKCAAVAIDISDFFGSVDHGHIKNTWKNLLGVSSLPRDHYKVLKSILQYRYVDRDGAYEALGYCKRDKKGTLRYVVDPKEIPLQITTMEKFKSDIVGGGLIKKNTSPYGIPQGLPISDLLANAYLIEFDTEMDLYARSRGGFYFRYSDDILIIIPGDGRHAVKATQYAVSTVSRHGEHIKINPDKTEIACYTGSEGRRRYYNLKAQEGSNSRKRIEANEGLSYLGFRFDGRKVYLRNSTINNLKRKISRSVRSAAHGHVDRHNEKPLEWLLENSPIDEVRQRFLNVADFDEAVSKAELATDSAYGVMTFWSYARRSARAFRDWDNRFFVQLKNIRKSMEEKLESEIRESFLRREGRWQNKQERLKERDELKAL